MTQKDKEDFSHILLENWPDGYFKNYGPDTAKRSLADCESHAHFFIPLPGRDVPEHCDWPELYIAFDIYLQNLSLDLRNPLTEKRETEGTINDGMHRAKSRVHHLQCRRFLWGQMVSVARADDEAALQTAKRVFSLASKFMSKSIERVTLPALTIIETSARTPMWSGPDLVRESQDDPHLFLAVSFQDDIDSWVGYRAVPRIRKPRARA